MPVKAVFLSKTDMDLPGELLVYAREMTIADDAPLFPSQRYGPDGRHKALDRRTVWGIVKAASARADVRVMAMRPSKDGKVGEPAPVHPHIFRHARVRQIMRTTKSLPLANRQAGWAVLQMTYLSVGDDEARKMMATVVD